MSATVKFALYVTIRLVVNQQVVFSGQHNLDSLDLVGLICVKKNKNLSFASFKNVTFDNQNAASSNFNLHIIMPKNYMILHDSNAFFCRESPR